MRVPYLLTVLAALSAGLAVGALSPRYEVEGLVRILLYILVFAAGAGIGRMIHVEGPPPGRAALAGSLLGVAVMAAGWASGYTVGLLLGVNPRLAGFAGLASGWYSIAGPLVSLYDPLLGLAAFGANLFREALHIALYPLLSRRGYKCTAVALGGATTMDTGLPVIVKYGGLEASALALGQGVIITLLVPVAASLLLP